MEFLVKSTVLLLCGVSATQSFLYGYQPMDQTNWNQYRQVQVSQMAPLQVQPAAYQQMHAAPVQVQPATYQQVQVAPVQAQPAAYQQMQVAPVQFFYQNWPQARQAQPAPVEPTIIVIRRSKPESHNINVTGTSNSSSVANANNNNSIQIGAPPQPPTAPAQSAPVSLQSVVVVNQPPNPAAPTEEAPLSARITDDVEITTTTTTTTEPPTTLAPTSAAPSHDEQPPQFLAAGIPNLPITLQSFVVLGGQQQPPSVAPLAPSVIAIQDESNTVTQLSEPNAETQLPQLPVSYATAPTASTIIPFALPNTEVQHLESATSIPSEYTTFEPELDIVQVPLAV